ncbi:MAG TPA: NAD(P)/FAD-dependent oxidoreductase [Actinocrinis sp.]|nr:NAD(P)/FAD-dependent oxidoreductase [Actinocrinis sp.]
MSENPTTAESIPAPDPEPDPAPGRAADSAAEPEPAAAPELSIAAVPAVEPAAAAAAPGSPLGSAAAPEPAAEPATAPGPAVHSIAAPDPDPVPELLEAPIPAAPVIPAEAALPIVAGQPAQATGIAPGGGLLRPGTAPRSGRHRVVIIGSGFGGLFSAKALRHKDVEVTLIAATPHHLFQPLLYQVATGILSQGEVAPATREILQRQSNAKVLLGEVVTIDPDARTVTARAPGRTTPYTVEYDSLILATGANQSYFDNPQFAEHAPGLKSIDDALEQRGRIFGAFELAELETDPQARQRRLTFVVVGAGATGVEMAGQIAELAHRALPGEYRRFDPRSARVILVDGVGRVLPAFGDHLSERAAARLTKLGVEIRLNTMVVGMDATGIELKQGDGGHERIEAQTKIWAAGVAASPLGRQLAEKTGAEVDRAGRVKVNPDCTLPGHPELFVIGDLMALDNLPGVAQVAIQSGRYAARQIGHRLDGKPDEGPFHYHDKGSMATVSRLSAVVSIGKLHFSGIIAWFLWLVIHLLYLVGFKNRLTTVLHWTVSFVGRARSERAVTAQQVFARTAMNGAVAPGLGPMPDGDHDRLM